MALSLHHDIVVVFFSNCNTPFLRSCSSQQPPSSSSSSSNKSDAAAAALRSQAATAYEGVKNWTKKVDLFSKQMVVVPICEESHW